MTETKEKKSAFLLGTTFKNIDFTTSFTDKNINDVTFDRCDFSGVTFKNCSIQACNFYACNLNNTTFENCEIGSNFSFSRMHGADLSGCNIFSSDFSYVTMSGAKLNGAQIIYANFKCAEMSDVDFTDLYIAESYLGSADMNEKVIQIGPFKGERLVTYFAYRDMICLDGNQGKNLTISRLRDKNPILADILIAAAKL